MRMALLLGSLPLDTYGGSVLILFAGWRFYKTIFAEDTNEICLSINNLFSHLRLVCFVWQQPV